MLMVFVSAGLLRTMAAELESRGRGSVIGIEFVENMEIMALHRACGRLKKPRRAVDFEKRVSL
jgi:hypothetical protein